MSTPLLLRQFDVRYGGLYCGHLCRSRAIDVEHEEQPLVYLLNSGIRIEPPFGRPDTDNPPSKIFEGGLAELVTIARGGRSVKLRAIGFDAGEISSGPIGMNYAEINTEVRNADLGVNNPIFSFEGALNGVLKWRLRVTTGWGKGFCDGPWAIFCEFKEVLEVDDPARIRTAEVDLIGVHTREDDHLAPRASNRDVEAAVAAFVVE